MRDPPEPYEEERNDAVSEFGLVGGLWWRSLTFTVTLPLDDRAHEDLNRPDVVQRYLALKRALSAPYNTPRNKNGMYPNLASRLVETQVVSQLLLAHSSYSVDLVAKDQERNFSELLDGEQRVELGFRLGETLVVGGVDQEDDTVDLGEVVAPETTGCCCGGSGSMSVRNRKKHR